MMPFQGRENGVARGSILPQPGKPVSGELGVAQGGLVRQQSHTIDPGLMSIAAKLAIMMPPVSVCHQLS
jgi:hypothetical protein